jgi:hypothetical protein
MAATRGPNVLVRMPSTAPSVACPLQVPEAWARVPAGEKERLEELSAEETRRLRAGKKAENAAARAAAKAEAAAAKARASADHATRPLKAVRKSKARGMTDTGMLARKPAGASGAEKPKRPPSAYALFLKDRWKSLKAAAPEMKAPEVPPPSLAALSAFMPCLCTELALAGTILFF